MIPNWAASALVIEPQMQKEAHSSQELHFGCYQPHTTSKPPSDRDSEQREHRNWRGFVQRCSPNHNWFQWNPQGGCYLDYEPESCGQLIKVLLVRYSRIPVFTSMM
ncbi:hypothetical protein V565_000100 [Rhizoctonia solani 123E]|uniref:Uncharacterized protein n=1 Tax=Rhizoctonia solani 123E TaxID=1423351 RepID=A0A074SG67_9AGAM|nr:hypothetical protein V565_000100 [Rhizoctonia solani 123E]